MYKLINLKGLSESISEIISQAEKDQYCMLPHIYGIWKKTKNKTSEGDKKKKQKTSHIKIKKTSLIARRERERGSDTLGIRN